MVVMKLSFIGRCLVAPSQLNYNSLAYGSDEAVIHWEVFSFSCAMELAF